MIHMSATPLVPMRPLVAMPQCGEDAPGKVTREPRIRCQFILRLATLPYPVPGPCNLLSPSSDTYLILSHLCLQVRLFFIRDPKCVESQSNVIAVARTEARGTLQLQTLLQLDVPTRQQQHPSAPISITIMDRLQALEAALDKIVLDPRYHDILTLVKGVRNGIVYGSKVRFPHALVYVLCPEFYFHSKTLALINIDTV